MALATEQKELKITDLTATLRCKVAVCGEFWLCI